MNQVLKENTIGIWKLDGNQLYGNDCFLDLAPLLQMAVVTHEK